jgi:hypothetical protein
MNGNARMKSKMSRLRVLVVMLSRKSVRKIACVNHSELTAHADFN